jgi:hypothetical protein
MKIRIKGLAIFGSFVDNLKQKSNLRIQSLRKQVRFPDTTAAEKPSLRPRGLTLARSAARLKKAASNKAISSPMK